MSDVQLRPLSPDELDEVCSLHNAADRHDGSPVVAEVEEFQEELDDEHVVFSTDTRAAELDGHLVGYAYTYHLPSDQREERCYVFGKVHPDHRRRGVGTALMQWGIRRGTEQLLSSGRALPAYVRVDVSDTVADAHRLFATVGMTPVRYMDELLRPLHDLPALSTVDGVAIVPWPDGRDDDIRAEKNISFEDHWGSTPTSAHHWEQSVHGYGARPDLSFVALDGDGNVVAHCLNKRYEADDELLGRRDGWIDNLGTLPGWRGRGIATALIAASLHAFAAEGFTHASIGVDSENPSGAAHLYRALGFQPNRRSITHELKVR